MISVPPPVSSHVLTFWPSQRLVPGTQELLPAPPTPKPPTPGRVETRAPPLPAVRSGASPPLFVPLQAASTTPKPMIAPTPRPTLLPMTLLQSQRPPKREAHRTCVAAEKPDEKKRSPSDWYFPVIAGSMHEHSDAPPTPASTAP